MKTASRFYLTATILSAALAGNAAAANLTAAPANELSSMQLQVQQVIDTRMAKLDVRFRSTVEQESAVVLSLTANNEEKMQKRLLLPPETAINTISAGCTARYPDC